MMDLILGGVSTAQLWYSVPLVIVVALVYGATRHEHPRQILVHSSKALAWIAVVMVIIFLLVWFFSRNL